MLKTKPKVSVIIPVYNMEKYLSQCVDSVIDQTYNNIEIILVDDGSIDGSADICDLYGLSDSRVKVIHQDNRGVAFARVRGLKESSGSFILFIDSDDWLDEKTVEICMRAMETYPGSDCILFSYIKEYPNHSMPMHILNKSIHMKNHMLEYKVYRRLFGLHGKELSHPERMETMASCCMKMYTKESVSRGKPFDLTRIGSSEDALFNMYALYGIKEAVYLDRCLYHYRKRPNTQTSRYRSQLMKQWKKLFYMMEEIIKEKHLNNTYREALSNRVALSIVSIGLNAISNKERNVFGQIMEIKSYLLDGYYQKNCRKMSLEYLPFVWKVYMICAKLKLAWPIYMMSQLIVIIRKR